MNLGQRQNNISELPTLNDYRYENIFKVYQTKDNQYFYNILSKVSFPDNLDNNLFYNVTVNKRTPWSIISYNAYGTIDLWWLIASINKITNPFILPENSTLKILKPEYISTVLNQINQSA